MNGKNMNSQRISFLSVAWLLLHSSYFLYLYFLLPCGNCSCVTCLFLEGHFGIHLEVASDSFCFLINSSWLLVFILYVFSLFFLGFNLYCLKGIHFSQNNFLMVLQLFFGLIFCSNIWFRDLLREFVKKYEVLLIIFFLFFLLFLVSEGLLFVSFFWTSFHSLSFNH